MKKPLVSLQFRPAFQPLSLRMTGFQLNDLPMTVFFFGGGWQHKMLSMVINQNCCMNLHYCLYRTCGHSHIIPQSSKCRKRYAYCRTLPNVISYSTTLSNLAVGTNGVTDDESGESTVVAKTHWQRGIALCAGCQQERLHANEALLGFGGGGN